MNIFKMIGDVLHMNAVVAHCNMILYLFSHDDVTVVLVPIFGTPQLWDTGYMFMVWLSSSHDSVSFRPC